MQLLKRTTLHCQEGSSDKVYEVDLCQTEGGYLVNFRYGRRGTTLKEGVKTTTPVPLAQAEKVFDKLVSEKTKKGYHDVSEPISAPETTPKVTFTSREQAILERLAGRGNPKCYLIAGNLAGGRVAHE
uniref:WGR domain-containing protein n=1 Tax=Desertifilum tharense IPPAS B-1220 TaxID=1781255 RepID=A0ACD5GP07_9CYAN